MDLGMEMDLLFIKTSSSGGFEARNVIIVIILLRKFWLGTQGSLQDLTHELLELSILDYTRRARVALRPFCVDNA